MMIVEPGQIWSVLDRRYDRTVLVRGFLDGRVAISSIADGGQAAKHVTYALIKRFNGRPGGYKYQGRVERYTVLPGQQWKERHTRNLRIVEVLSVKGDFATIIPVRIQAPDGKEIGTGQHKATKAHLSRFSTKGRGYKRIY